MNHFRSSLVIRSLQASQVRAVHLPRIHLYFALQVLLALSTAVSGLAGPARTIGNHPAVYDQNGMLRPWMPWGAAIELEVNWYLKCPVEHGYPRFAYLTFMDGDYRAVAGSTSFIPATQDGLGIISYLKYYAYKQKQDPQLLRMARYLGDYLVNEAVTPGSGKYPQFSRSTGLPEKFPQPPDCGSQADRPFEIEPDKGGIAGYALLLLYEETNDEKYLQQALQNARVLSANMREGTATNSPWPFRVDYRTGEPRGDVSSNLAFILRLFDRLIENHHPEFKPSRERLWRWIKEFQIPDLKQDCRLWVQFFEDHHEPDNRNAWSPLNLARYLIEKKEVLDPDWRQDSRALIEFVNRHFITVCDGVAVCGEQTNDMQPWGGVLSTYGAVLAMYGRATGSDEFKAISRQALNYCLYAINDDGCPGDLVLTRGRGGWQEDAHTDKLHNFVDAMTAYPEWAR